MPIVRFGGEGEGAGGAAGGLAGGDLGSRDLNRVVSNITLADHVGKFMAGEIQSRFQDENLADMLKGKNQIMVSGSWG